MSSRSITCTGVSSARTRFESLALVLAGVKEGVFGERMLGARKSAFRRRRRVVARSAGRGGRRCEEVRIVLRKCGCGRGRPELRQAAESWAGVVMLSSFGGWMGVFGLRR